MRYLFEDCVLDTECRELLRGADAVALEPQVFDLLVYLICNRERVVSRDDLLASVWKGRLVSESALNTRIHLARSAVGDNGEDQRLIKTFPRKGIRFVAPVKEDQGTANAVSERTGLAAETHIADAAARIALPCRGDLSDAMGTPAKSASSGGSGAKPSDGSQKIANNAAWWLGAFGLWQSLWQSPRRTAALARNPASVREGGVLMLRRRSLSLVVVVVSAVLVSSGWILRPWLHAASPTGVLSMMAAPTIAVLPFTIAGAQDNARLRAPRLDAEVGSELARVHRGFDLIISSARDNRGRTSPLMVTAKQGVRYLVVGTTWLDGEVQHANIQLIEAETDRQIWSEPFELNRGQIDAINRLAVRVARLIIIQIRTAESHRPLPPNVEAGHYVLQGRSLLDAEHGATSTSEAQALFKRALQLDAKSFPALQGLATSRLVQIQKAWIPREQRPLALIEAEETISRMAELDPGNPAGHYLRAKLLRALGKVDLALASLEHALSLNPNYVPAHALLGRLKIDAGRAHEAIPHLEHAIELSPTEPDVHLLYRWAGVASLHLADDKAAVQWLLKARQANPNIPLAARFLAVAYLGVGDEEKARATAAEAAKVSPKFTIATWTMSQPTPNTIVAKQRQRILDGWRRLGVPEGDTGVASGTQADRGPSLSTGARPGSQHAGGR